MLLLHIFVMLLFHISNFVEDVYVWRSKNLKYTHIYIYYICFIRSNFASSALVACLHHDEKKKTWWCQCCKKHRSTFPRQCICCKLWIAPGCVPEQCLAMDEKHGASFNLCKKCFFGWHASGTSWDGERDWNTASTSWGDNVDNDCGKKQRC